MMRLLKLLQAMGFLRNLLQGSAFASTLLLPFARTIDYSGDWNLFFAGILPAVSPILVVLLGLDIMVSNIWRADAEGNEERIHHFSRIIRANQIFGGMLLLMWLAVFLPVLLD